MPCRTDGGRRWNADPAACRTCRYNRSRFYRTVARQRRGVTVLHQTGANAGCKRAGAIPARCRRQASRRQPPYRAKPREPAAAAITSARSSTTGSTCPTRPRRCSPRSPGISKQVRQLEDELGVRVFVRQGKRLAWPHAGRRSAGRDRAPRAARDREPEARRRRVPQRRRRHAGDRDHPHAGALRAAAGAAGFRRRAIPRSSSCCTRATRSRSPSTRLRGDVDVGIATEALAGYSGARHPAVLPVEPLRARAARPSARQGEAADARGARAPSHRHLRLRVHRAVADQRRLRRRRARRPTSC